MAGLRMGLSLQPKKDPNPVPPPGFTFLLDSDGTYLLDASGNFLLAPA